MKKTREIVVVDDDADQDAEFLSLVDAIESDAAKSKLQKTEGPYLAALRGSRSSLWQKQQEELRHLHDKKGGNVTSSVSRSHVSTFSDTGGGGGGGCFKCGMEGHWARDCTAKDRSAVEGDVADKACPCGIGSCLVLTSNTPKNPGRKFYRCPVREENGGCNFFEWCDNPSSGLPTSGSTTNFRTNPSVPDFPCPCGAGSCLILVAKTGNNVGRQFYRCPANEGSGSCGYFKWCVEATSAYLQPASSLPAQGAFNSSTSRFSGERNGSCFKCGGDGHWARDCTKPTSDPNADGEVNCLASSGSGSCFKCGKAGHWARDCSAQGSKADNSSQKTRPFHTPFANKY